MTENDVAWDSLFKKYEILKKVETNGYFEISAKQIKETRREPRLMAKFDHSINLPKLFQDNKLSILPISRGDYVISHFEAYHGFEESGQQKIYPSSLPSHIQSLDFNNITSESIALNCAYASGIISDFVEDDNILPTVSGRMGSGKFSFSINDVFTNSSRTIFVNNAQVEIDAAYEGLEYLALFEAKLDISDDFLIRQLYYPFRIWQDRVGKKVKPIFLVYSNGIYRLFEYSFNDINDYSSLKMVKQRNYSIEETSISCSDIQSVLDKTQIVEEPHIPFPQADKFERVINLCELLYSYQLSEQDITEKYAFDKRQTGYYTNAALYLGLIEKIKLDEKIVYELSIKGRRILELNYKSRQLAYCKCILSHEVFRKILIDYLSRGEMPSSHEIIECMKHSALYKIESEETYKRRSSTIKCWVNWIVSICTE